MLNMLILRTENVTFDTWKEIEQGKLNMLAHEKLINIGHDQNHETNSHSVAS